MQQSLIDTPAPPPPSPRTTSKGIAPGDIVQVDKKGRRFYALVTELDQQESGRFELCLRPLDSRISYRTATVREVTDVWRKVSQDVRRDSVGFRRMAVATHIAGALEEARRRTLALVAPFSDAEVETAHSALMSPLVWDLAHIAAYEDLWLVHRHGGEPLLQPEQAAMYDAFETPRAVRGDLPLLDRGEALAYLADVRERALAILDRRGPGEVHEMVLQHELQHTETMLQAIELARLPTAPGLAAALRPGAGTGLEAIEIPAGAFAMGAPDEQLRVRQRASPPHGRPPGLPDRPHAHHQRDVPPLRRGRRLPAPRVVVGRGLGLEGGVRHHAPPRLGRRARGVAAVAHRRLVAAAPSGAGGPHLLVRGRRLRQSPLSPAPDRGRVGEGGDLDPGDAR